jgi:DNA-binding XRE family transcriptional regulator
VSPGLRLWYSGKCLRTCPTCGDGQIEKVNPVWLRHVREGRGIGLNEMAKRVGISPSYLCDIEKERRGCPPKVEAAYRKLTKRRRAAGAQKGRK